MTFLTISGSLRQASSNSTLLRALAALAPAGVQLVSYTGLAGLPHFNPELERDAPSRAVAAFRAELQAADAVIISSPEYAHGVPGTLKNALDWVVGSGELSGKPMGLLNTAPRATHAQASLIEILTTMDAHVLPAASPTVPLAGNTHDEAGIAADPELAPVLRAALSALADAVTNPIRDGGATGR